LREEELSWERDKSQRKKTGSYYTPEYIVSYIVGETLGPLVDEIKQGLKEERTALEGEIHRARGENRRLLEQQRDDLLKKARERVLDLKVLDPAMGSGHFLVSACDYLARRIAELEAELTEKETEEAVQELKRTVAIRCLHGVDLNPLATELAKLSLWLHTVAKGKPLSFLDHHLRTGNSLIGVTVRELERPPSGKPGEIGLWESKIREELGKAIRHLAFIKEATSDSRTDIEAKKKHWELVNTWIGKYKQAANVWLSTCFGSKVSDGDYQQVLETAAGGKLEQVSAVSFFHKAQEIATEKRFFHWELEFPDVFFDRFGRPLANPGFDAVIGNPPYVRQEQIKESKSCFKTAFETYTGVADLYIYFYEKSHRLLRQGGHFGMITSNKFIRAAYGEKLKAFLAKEVTIEAIIDFGDLPVFPGVSAYPCVFLTVNSPCDEQTLQYLQIRSLEFDDLSTLVREKAAELPADAVQGSQWTLASGEEQRVLHKMKQMSLPLVDWLRDVEIRRGVLTGFNQAFFIDAATRERLITEDPKSAELIKLLVIGEDIKRYEVEYKRRYLIWTYVGVPIEEYPAIFNHLKQFQLELEKRWDKGDHWWELRHCDYYAEFEKPKIMYQEIAKFQAFARDENHLFCNNKLFTIPTDSSYLFAILNASLVWLYLTSQVSKLHGNTFALQSIYVEQIPIRRIAFTTPKKERERLVEEGKRLYSEALGSLRLEGEVRSLDDKLNRR